MQVDRELSEGGLQRARGDRLNRRYRTAGYMAIGLGTAGLSLAAAALWGERKGAKARSMALSAEGVGLRF